MFVSEQSKRQIFSQRISIAHRRWPPSVQTAARQQSFPAAVCTDSGAAERFWDQFKSPLCVFALRCSAQSHGILHRVRHLFISGVFRILHSPYNGSIIEKRKINVK